MLKLFAYPQANTIENRPGKMQRNNLFKIGKP